MNAWFGLTEREQKAVVIVLALALLGIAAKSWHVRITDDRGQMTPHQSKHDAGQATDKGVTNQ